MKKVLVYCPYYPPHVGGLESHAQEFNKYLAKDGFEITVFTPNLPVNNNSVESEDKNIKIVRFPAWEIIPNYPLPQFWNLKFWKLWQMIWNEKYDWIISRTRFFNTSLMALWHSKIKNINWMHIEHGSDFVKLNNKFVSGLAELYDKSFGYLVLRWAKKVVANSEASAEFCRKIFPKRIYEVIYRGVELEDIKNIKPNLEVLNKYRGVFKMLYVGRLIDGKGVGDLIEAVKKIKNSKWVLFIVGDGPKRKEWEKVAGDGVLFLGQKTKDEVVGIMKVVDVVINPSYTEGLPTSMIEAAACDKPVVATDVGGTREIVEDGVMGYLVKPKDVKQLVEKIETLMKDTLKTKGLSDKFNWNKSIEKYIKLLSAK